MQEDEEERKEPKNIEFRMVETGSRAFAIDGE